MTQDLLQKVLGGYDLIMQHLSASGDMEVLRIIRDIQTEKGRLVRVGVNAPVREAKEFALSLWVRLNDQLYDKYVSACSGNAMRLQIPAAVGAAMELVNLFEAEEN